MEYWYTSGVAGKKRQKGKKDRVRSGGEEKEPRKEKLNKKQPKEGRGEGKKSCGESCGEINKVQQETEQYMHISASIKEKEVNQQKKSLFSFFLRCSYGNNIDKNHRRDQNK